MTSENAYNIRMKGKVKRIFVDMDGVLCDFLRGCETYLGHPLTNDDKGHTEYDERKQELTDKRLFRNLPPMVDYHELIGYVKHTGVDASGSAVTTTLNIELTGDVVIGKLAAGEFMFMPVGGHSLGVQLQASSGTIVAEYAYFTKG